MAGHDSPRAHTHISALGQRVRALREARGWDREQLAEKASLNVEILIKLESDGVIQPGFFTVGALAEALEVSLDDLFRAARAMPGLWSAGYEGRDIDSFVAALRNSRIDVVADVRLTPISRKPGFSKTRLGLALTEVGITYTHMRGLGNPKDNRAPFWDGRLDVGRARFRSVLRSEQAQSDLDCLAAHARQSRVAVLCFERDESRCHRQVVLDALRNRAAVQVSTLA